MGNGNAANVWTQSYVLAVWCRCPMGRHVHTLGHCVLSRWLFKKKKRADHWFSFSPGTRPEADWHSHANALTDTGRHSYDVNQRVTSCTNIKWKWARSSARGHLPMHTKQPDCYISILCWKQRWRRLIRGTWLLSYKGLNLYFLFLFFKDQSHSCAVSSFPCWSRADSRQSPALFFPFLTVRPHCLCVCQRLCVFVCVSVCLSVTALRPTVCFL